MKKILFLIPLLTFIVYLLTGNGHTPFNHFTLLADSFLHGKLYITAQAPWLEKIPINQEDFYVANPPGPALLSIPFVFLFGKNFPQEYIAYFVGSIIVLFTMLISLEVKRDIQLVVWSGLFAGVGNIIWFLSSVGSTWYLGETTGALFITIALYESLTKKRVWLVGLFLGLAYLSRIHLILSLPLFIYLLKDKLKILKNVFYFSISFGFFIILNAMYNFARFGVFWDKGYTLIAHVLDEPWYQKGIINPSYILNNLRVAFGSLPKFTSTFPYLIPSWGGLAIWITTPAFIFSLFAKLRDHLNKFLWLSVITIALFVFMHGDTGYTQFGYRFAVDFYPFLFLLTIKGVARTGLRKIHWGVLIISILVNTWGVILINKFALVAP